MTSWDEDQEDAIIQYVREHPCFYNTKSPDYKNRDLRSAEWENLAGKFDVTVQVMRAKWKALNDAFNRCLKEKSGSKSGSGAEVKPKWVHFEKLQFLAPFRTARETQTSLVEENEEKRAEVVDLTHNNAEEEQQAEPESGGKRMGPPPSSTPVSKKKKKPAKDNFTSRTSRKMPGSKRRSSITKAVQANGEVSLKVEHTKSAAAKCRVCKEHLQKGALRINAEHEGFYHPECFKEAKGFDGKSESLEGFDELDDEEKRELEQSFTESPAKKEAPKAEEQPMAEAEESEENPLAEAEEPKEQPTVDADESEEKPLAEAPEEKKHSPPEGDLEAEKAVEEQDVMLPPAVKKIKLDETSEGALKKQTEVLAEVRRLCYTNMLEAQMVVLLKANNVYNENATIEETLEMLVDAAVFGVPLPCPECNGIVAFRKSHNAYACLGCGEFETKEPPRKEMVIPVGMADNDFLASYAIPKLPKRIIEEKSKAVIEDDA